MKIFDKIILFLVLPIISFGQKGSIVLFDESRAKQYEDTLFEQLGIYNTYKLENLNCYGFIFDTIGDVWYEDSCPGDYTDRSKFGTYSINYDTINIYSTFIQTQEGLHRIAIKDIKHTIIDKDTLTLKALNSDGIEFGSIVSIWYKKYPIFPWRKVKYVDLKRPYEYKKLPDKIFVDKIWISEFDNVEGKWFAINEKWKIKKKRIDVTFFGESLKIVKRGDELILYRWNRSKKTFLEFDRLMHKI